MKKFKFTDDQNDNIEISLTPLIDTVLVLLIVFIAATPIIHHSIKVSLPNGSKTEHNELKNDICFAIDQYGKIYNEEKKNINFEQAIEKINKVISNDPEFSVIIFADKDALCGIVIEFIDKLKKTGVKNVYCKTKKIII